MEKERRIEIANDTLAILEKGFYNNSKGKEINIALIQSKAVDNTRLYRPEELDELLTSSKKVNNFQTRYEVTNETTLDAARRLTAEGERNALCLNFASGKNPGGGFLRGTLAQEECIARATGLYPCLLTAKEYYEYNRKQGSAFYSDHMIYSPDVPIIKDEDGNLLDEVVCTSIITSPAVQVGDVRINEMDKIDKIIPVMKVRMEKLLALCLW